MMLKAAHPSSQPGLRAPISALIVALWVKFRKGERKENH